MIIREIKREGDSSFRRLAEYILNPQKKATRVAASYWTNMPVNGDGVPLDNEDCIQAVLATQGMNHRAKSNKTYHLLISFPLSEQPDLDTLKGIENEVIKALGFSEYERCTAVHTDTDNLHLQIAINKIHPKKYTIHEPYYSHRTMGEIATALEKKYALQSTNHIGRTSAHVNSGADAMDRAGKVESLAFWIRERCLDELLTASTWEEVRDILALHDLNLKKRGNGLIFEGGDIAVSASTVKRELSLKNMEKRLGVYVEGGSELEAMESYTPAPVDKGDAAHRLWGIYRQILDERKFAIKIQSGELREAVKMAKISFDFEYELMRLTGTLDENMLGYNRRIYELKIEKAKNILNLEKRALERKVKVKPWREWMKDVASLGNPDALSVLEARRKKREERLKYKENMNSVTGELSDLSRLEQPERISDTGEKIYTDKIGDNGSRLKIHALYGKTLGPEEKALCLALLKASQEKFSGPLTVTGSESFKSDLVEVAIANSLEVKFANVALENRRKTGMREQRAAYRTGKALEYINGRNGFRLRKTEIDDIKLHVFFSEEKNFTNFIFQGIRNKDDVTLLLLEHQDVMYVQPITDQQASFIRSHFSVGDGVAYKQSKLEKRQEERPIEREVQTQLEKRQEERPMSVGGKSRQKPPVRHDGR